MVWNCLAVIFSIFGIVFVIIALLVLLIWNMALLAERKIKDNAICSKEQELPDSDAKDLGNAGDPRKNRSSNKYLKRGSKSEEISV